MSASDEARARRVEEVFAAALDRPASERDAYLDTACAGDAALRAELGSLLSFHARASAAGWLSSSPAPELQARMRGVAGLGEAERQIGPYRLIAPAGQGGMGVVWRAWDTRLQRTVALKHLSGSGSPDATERFFVEARAAAALDHPNICTIHGLGETGDGELYIAMAWYDGETVAQMLERGPLPIDRAIDLVLQILAGLEQAHARGIVHRDVKPANVLVTTDGVAKLLDFGVAKLSDISLTSTGLLIGTTAYMSPEQVLGRTVDARSDLWSVGVVLFELVAGSRPFAGDDRAEVLSRITSAQPPSIRTVRPDAPAGLERVLRRALAKRPVDRPMSASEMMTELRALSDGTPLRSGRTWRRASAAAAVLGRRAAHRPGLLIATVAAVTLFSALALSTRVRREIQAGDEPLAASLSALPAAAVLSPNAEAADAYARGRMYDANLLGDLAAALAHYERAVALDSQFAAAHARLANTYARMAVGVADPDSARQLRDRAFLALHDALALDSTLAEAYAARGDLLWSIAFGFPHERAAADLKRAIALDPTLAWPHQSLGSVYMHVGLFDKALAQFDTVLALSTGHPQARLRIPRVHLYQGRYALALQGFEAVPEQEVSWQNVVALHHLGRTDEALAHAERLVRRFPHSADAASVFAIVLASAGRREEAERQIRSSIASGSGSSHFHHAAYGIASAYALMHDDAQAIEWLRRTAEEGMPCYPLFRDDPNLDGLRDIPEFQHFIQEMERRWLRARATL